MTIQYLNELLTARCEAVAETIAEMRRVGALKDAISIKAADLADCMVRLCADWFRTVPKDDTDADADAGAEVKP